MPAIAQAMREDLAEHAARSLDERCRWLQKQSSDSGLSVLDLLIFLPESILDIRPKTCRPESQ